MGLFSPASAATWAIGLQKDTIANFTKSTDERAKYSLNNFATINVKTSIDFTGDEIFNVHIFNNEQGSKTNIKGIFYNGYKGYNAGAATNAGELTFNGNFYSDYGSTFTNKNGGTATFNGVFSNNNSDTAKTTIFTNESGGKVEISASSTSATNAAGASISNAGTFTSGADFTNSGKFENSGTATFSKAFTNSGEFTNAAKSTATFEGTTTLAKNSTTTNSGAMNFKGALSNKGTLTNDGTLTSSGEFKNTGDITNNGTFTSEGDFTHIALTFKNNKTATFKGAFVNKSYYDNNENSTTTFNGTAEFTHDSTTTNLGTMTFNDGAKVTGGTQGYNQFVNKGKMSFDGVDKDYNFYVLENYGGTITNNGKLTTEYIFSGGKDNGGTESAQGSEIINNATLTSNGRFENRAGATFTNAENSTATFNGLATFEAGSTVSNAGTMTFNGGSESNLADFVNEGTMNFNKAADGTDTTYSFDKLTNKGIVEINDSKFTGTLNNGEFNSDKDYKFGILNVKNADLEGAVVEASIANKINIDGTTKFGALNNAGTVNVKEGAIVSFLKVDNKFDGTYSARFDNNGTSTFSEDFKNTGRFYNTGTATFSKALANNGEFGNNAGGTVTLNGKTTLEKGVGIGLIANDGTLINNGELTIAADDSRIDNSGIFTNNGTITNSGKINNKADATLTNAGALTNSGTLTNAGTLTNSGTLTNLGTLTSESSGKLENSGTIENSSTIAGALTNSGVINANAGSVFSGAITNNKTINAKGGEFSGAITTAADSAINVSGAAKFTNNAAFENVANAKFNVASGSSAEFSNGVKNAGEMSVNGGALTATEFTNSGTLKFSAANNALGKVVATTSFKNETDGKVEVDTTGLHLNQELVFIDSETITGLNGKVTIKSSDKYDYTQGEGRLRLSGFEALGASENHNAIQNAIEQAVIGSGGQMSKAHARQAISDTESHIKQSVIAQPKTMLNAIKANAINTPLQAAYVARLTASSEAILSDAGEFVNPLQRTTETQFFLMPFGGALNGNEVSGSVLGFSLGLTHIGEDYIAQGHFSYANGDSTQDLATQSTDTNGNLFQVGAFTRLFFLEKLETDINLSFLLGAFKLENSWKNGALENSSANFKNYQGSLGVSVGWRFGENLSFKPYLGLQGHYEKQGEIHLDNLQLRSDAYNTGLLDGLVGVEGRYIFEGGNFIFVGASFQNKLYNSHKEVFMRVAENELSYENERYDSIIGANIGARVLNLGAFKLDIEGVYKHYNTGLNYYGGSLNLRVAF